MKRGARFGFLVLCLSLVPLLGTPPAVVAQDAGQGTSEPLTILLMGLDRRPGEPIDSGVRPDFTAVLHIDVEANACRLLSIPRDTRVPIPGYGQSKINHAYAFGGSELAVETVQGYLGIPIDHYAALDMDGAAELIDFIGGVTIDEPEQFSYGVYTYVSSPQTLSGEEAIIYARYRGGPDGDFGRIRRQQQVLRELLAEDFEIDLDWVLLNLAPTLAEHFRSDLSIPELLELGRSLRTVCTSDNFATEVLEGVAALDFDEAYQQELWMVLVEPDEVERKVQWLVGG
jgi:LCP family protein required for cell wall assembly